MQSQISKGHDEKGARSNHGNAGRMGGWGGAAPETVPESLRLRDGLDAQLRLLGRPPSSRSVLGTFSSERTRRGGGGTETTPHTVTTSRASVRVCLQGMPPTPHCLPALVRCCLYAGTSTCTQ